MVMAMRGKLQAYSLCLHKTKIAAASAVLTAPPSLSSSPQCHQRRRPS